MYIVAKLFSLQMDRYRYNVDGTAASAQGTSRGSSSSSSIDRGTDYLSTGGVLGELALLSGKPTACVITCETSVQMYKIPYEAIQAALELFTETHESLEYRLWKVCAIRIATNILRTQPHYLPWTIERIKLHLEKCLLHIKKNELPEGGQVEQYPIFDINPLTMADIVLAHGFATDPDSGRDYLGPCYIPIKTERLILVVS